MEEREKKDEVLSLESIPLTGIVELEPESDVECDKGAKSLIKHDKFKALLKKNLIEFENSSKVQKPVIALNILNEWRRKHKGRMVKFDSKRNLWSDIGDKKARELISKALKKLLSSEKEKISLIDNAKEVKEPTTGQRGSSIKKVQKIDAGRLASTFTAQTTEESTSLMSNSSHNIVDVSFINVLGKRVSASESQRTISGDIRRNVSHHRHLYGRDREERQLLELYRDSVSTPVSPLDISDNKVDSKTNFLIISGEGGVGKTALALSLKPSVVDDNGIFIEVKFDQLESEESLSNMKKFLNRITQLIVDMEDFHLRHKYCKKVAEIINENFDEQIVNIIPPLEKIQEIGSTTYEGKNWLQNGVRRRSSVCDGENCLVSVQGNLSIPRLRFLLIKIMRAIASPEHPLVLFLDNLQYSYSMTSNAYDNFFQELVQGQSGIFLLATFGTEGLTGEEKANIPDIFSDLPPDIIALHECQLAALSQKAVHELITETLSLNHVELVSITETFFDLTAGNALFLLELLRTFQEDDLLQYDTSINQWKCDAHLIRQHPLLQVRFVEDLYVAKIFEMPDDVQETLKISSALGTTFSQHVLTKILGQEEATSHCDAFIHAGLLTRDVQNEYGIVDDEQMLAFCHGSIHRAVYGLILDSDKSSFAFNLGMRLWKKIKKEEEMEQFIFVIMRLLVRGQDSISNDSPDRAAIASLCLQAAEKASKSTGFDQCVSYLELGINVLGPLKWRENYNLCLALFNNGIDAYYGIGDFEKVTLLIDEVMEMSRVFEDTFQARIMQVYTLGTTKGPVEALNFGLKTLSMLGENFPANPSMMHVNAKVSEIRLLLKKHDSTLIPRLPLMTDPRRNAAMIMLQFVFYLLAAYQIRPSFAYLISCRMIDLTIGYGASPVSSIGFAGFGLLMCIDGKNAIEAYSYGNIAIAFSNRFGGDAWICRVTAAVFGCINIWNIPLRNCLEMTRRAYLIGLGTGDLQLSMMNAALYLWTSFEILPITEIYNFIHCLIDRMTFLGQKQFLAPLWPLFQMCKYFMGQTWEKPQNIHIFIKEGAGLEEIHQESRDKQLKRIDFYSMITAYHFSDFELAEKLSPNAAQLYSRFSSYVATVGRTYEALNIVARSSKCGRNRIRAARHHLRIIQQWSQNCPENFIGKQFLLEAELAALLNNHNEAKTKYYLATIQFRDAGILMQEALANELAGKFYLKIGIPSKATPLFVEARRLYKTWGGIAKLRHLDQEIGYLFVD